MERESSEELPIASSHFRLPKRLAHPVLRDVLFGAFGALGQVALFDPEALAQGVLHGLTQWGVRRETPGDETLSPARVGQWVREVSTFARTSGARPTKSGRGGR